jgi:GAF domain-containing protein
MDDTVMSNWKSELQHRRTVFLEHFLRTTTVAGFLAVIAFYLSLPREMALLERVSQVVWFLAAWLIVVVTWLWRGLGYRTRTWIAMVLTYALGIFIFVRGDLPGSGRVWLLLPPALALILLGIESGLWSAGVSLLIYVVFAVLFSQGWLAPLAPLEEFGAVGAWVGEGVSFVLVGAVLVLLLTSFSRGWLDALARADSTNEQLQMRTKELVETANQLRATAAISQVCSSTLELDTLLAEVVERIQREFEHVGVYYVELFLLDQSGSDGIGQFAVLKAATGSIGQHFLEQEHKVALDRTTAVGRSLVYRKSVLAPSAEEGVVLLDNPLLDRTRTEIALPMNSRGRILGALSVQSTHEAAFDEDDVSVLQTMAEQIAVAFDNAHLFAQTGAALREMESAQRRYLTEAWREFLNVEAVNRVDYVKPGVEVGKGDALREARQAAVAHRRTVATEGVSGESEDGSPTSGAVLAVPLKLRGQVVGTLSLHETQSRRTWTSEEMALAEAVAEQVALTVDNLRLMDETQRRAAQERLIGEVTAHMRETLDVDTVLQVAAREIHRALGLRDVTIQLAADADRTVQ